MKYLTFKNLLIAALIVIVAILLLKGCGGATDRSKEAKRISDSIEAAYDVRIKDYDTKLKSKDDSLSNAKIKTQAAIVDRNQKVGQLAASNAKGADLARRIKQLLKDTSNAEIVIVPCDSLATIVIDQEMTIAQLDTALIMLDSLMQYETSIRDEVIILLQEKFITCDSAYKGEKKRFDKLYADLRPRNQVFVGMEISGSAITPFNQVGPVVSLVTKNGKMFQVGGGLQVNGSYYVKVGASFKIKLRK